MKRLERASMAVGALLIVAGVAWLLPAAAVIVAGVLLVAAGWDRA